MPEQLQLIPDVPHEGTLLTIPMSAIPDKYLSSSRKPDAAMRNSVARFGVLTPILVCFETEDDAQFCQQLIQEQGLEDVAENLRVTDTVRFRLLAGRRRVLAAKEAGMEDVRAVVFPYGTDHSTVTIIENQVRSDNPLVELAEVQRLINQGHGLPEISQATGINVQTAQKRLKLLCLNPDLRVALRDGKIPLGVAEYVSAFSPAEQERLVAVLQSTGRVKAKDARAIRSVQAEEAVTALPDVLFNPDPSLGAAFPLAEDAALMPMVALAPHVPQPAPVAPAPVTDSLATAIALLQQADAMLVRLGVSNRIQTRSAGLIAAVSAVERGE